MNLCLISVELYFHVNLPETLKPQFQHVSHGVFRRHVTFLLLLFFFFLCSLFFTLLLFILIQFYSGRNYTFSDTWLLVCECCLRWECMYWLIRPAYHATRHSLHFWSIFISISTHLYSVVYVCECVRVLARTARLLSSLCIDNNIK